jgi:Mrp family chromosome partitioning ATPase
LSAVVGHRGGKTSSAKVARGENYQFPRARGLRGLLWPRAGRPATDVIGDEHEQDYRRFLSEIEQEIDRVCPDFQEFVLSIRRFAGARLSATGHRVIGVVSARESEGRTTVGLALASALAEIHNQVAFVEARAGTPTTLSTEMLQPQSQGTEDYIAALVPTKEVLQPTRKKGLWLVPAGQARSEISPLEAVGGMRRLISELRPEFDCVVVDLPPLLFNEGSAAVVSELDSVIFVVGAGQAAIADVDAASRLCGTVPVDGVFINRAVYKTPSWLMSLLGLA